MTQGMTLHHRPQVMRPASESAFFETKLHPSLKIHRLFSSTMMLRFLALLPLTTAFAPLQTPFRSASSLGAVSKKDSYSVTLLPGDGIGPEITAATKEALQALCDRCGFSLELKEALIGGAAIDEANDPFPDASLQQCLASDSVLLACIGGYKWDNNPRELRPESGLLKMRKEMGLFANLRPAKVLPQLLDASTLKREVVEGVDVMVVRELTGDVYFGTPKGIDVVNGERVGYNNMIYSESEILRIAKVAGDVASKRNGKLCSVGRYQDYGCSRPHGLTHFCHRQGQRSRCFSVVARGCHRYHYQGLPGCRAQPHVRRQRGHAADPMAEAVRYHRLWQHLW